MYAVHKNRLEINTLTIHMRKVVILLLLCCCLRQAFSVRIKLFKSEPFGAAYGSIRLSLKQKLSLECAIESSSGQQYVARITNEEGVVLASRRDTNDSILTHTIHQVACHDIGSLTCELEDQSKSELITSTLYLMVENCLPRTCKGSKPDLKMVVPHHSNGSLSLCVIADTSRFIDMKVYINGERLKLTDQHFKYRFDVERNEPSFIHYTVHLIVLNVATADYGTYIITATTGGDYAITYTAQIDGVGKPCPGGWCETRNRTCLQLMKTGQSHKKYKRKCEHFGGTLFNGTIRQTTQYSNNSLLSTDRKDHIDVYEDNETCNVYTWANHTGKDIADFTASSDFHMACQIPYWSEVTEKTQGQMDPVLSPESSDDDGMSVYVSVGAPLFIVLVGTFIGVLCYRRRVHYKRSKSFKSRLLESSSTTDAAYFEKADRESIYHTLEEAAVATIRDTDDGHDYDLTIDEPALEDFKSPHIKRESIKPLPPPRSSEKNKLGTQCFDVSVYDVCGVQCIAHPVMNIADSTSHDIVSIQEEDSNRIENDFDLLNGDKGNTISLEKTLRNQNDNTGSSEKNKCSNASIEIKNDTTDYSTPLSTKEEHQYSGYVKESMTKGEDSLQTLKATMSYTNMIHKEDTCQELDNKTLSNSTKHLKENHTPQASGKDIDSSKNDNSKLLMLDLEDTEAYERCYSLPFKRNDDHIYNSFSCVDSSGITSNKENDPNACDVQKEEHTKNLTDRRNVECNCNIGSDAFEKSRVSYVDLTDQADNADHENFTSSILSKDCIMRDRNSYTSTDGAVLKCNANGLAGEVISSNGTNVEGNAYKALFDSETNPTMLNGDTIAKEQDDMNNENWYLQFDGAQCEDVSQMKPGCESNEEYMTWDGGDVSIDEEVPSNNTHAFALSSGEVAFNMTSRKDETSRNHCVENIEEGNSEIQEASLVYWTPDGTKKRALGEANPPLSDEYSAPYDFLTKY
ncbi:unnamed protein product [Lymnaea stagnalis]|uniref:Uncharacterized protein n=1 Tax=Lymnaea stagnalis TaxID=6523 RepID=A0AAV2I8U9_LYMST